MTPVPETSPRVGGSFSLTNHNGDRVTDDDYRGRFLLVFFGFSHCREVCPRVLTKLTSVIDRLGEDSRHIQPLYITVDPDRDSPQVLKAYLSRYHPNLIGLTGAPEEIDRVKANYRVFARRQANRNEPGAYDVPHTSLTYLIGPNGEYRTHFSDTIDEETITSRLKDELRGLQDSHESAEEQSETTSSCH